MAEYWYNNGQSQSSLGKIGYTGANRYVVVYSFTVGSSGCSSVTVNMSNMFSHTGSNDLCLKIGTFPSQYASGTASPDGTGTMSWGSSWGGSITCNINLTEGTYYATIYATSVGYWDSVYSDAGDVSTSGSYTPATSLEFTSVSSSVETQNNVLLTVNNSSSVPVIAYFSYNGTPLASSDTFTTQLSYTCPRSWLSNNISVATMSITVTVKKTDGTVITNGTKSFTLNADSGMKPVVTTSSFTASMVNTGTIAAFIATLTKIRIAFARSGSSYVADMSNTANAEIRSVWIEYNGNTITSAESGSPYSYLTGAITSSGAGYVRVWMKDSRDRTGYKDYSFSAYAYVPPSVTSADIVRCDTSGDPSDTGTRYKVNITATSTAIGNDANARTVTSYSKKTSDTNYGTGTVVAEGSFVILGTVLDATAAYMVKIVVADAAGGSQEYIYELSFEKWMICWTSTGEGCGIGQAPGTDNVLQIPSTWEFLAGSARLGNSRMVLVDDNHYGTQSEMEAISNPVEGQIFYVMIT